MAAWALVAPPSVLDTAIDGTLSHCYEGLMPGEHVRIYVDWEVTPTGGSGWVHLGVFYRLYDGLSPYDQTAPPDPNTDPPPAGFGAGWNNIVADQTGVCAPLAISSGLCWDAGGTTLCSSAANQAQCGDDRYIDVLIPSVSGHPGPFTLQIWGAGMDGQGEGGSATVAINRVEVDGDIVANSCFVAPPPPPPPGHPIDIYTPTDPPVFVARIDNAEKPWVWPRLNRPGEHGFSINKNHPQATTDILKRGNLVRYTFEEIDPNPIFEGFLEAGDFDLISRDEEGGEELVFGGSGNMSVLTHDVPQYVEEVAPTGHVIVEDGVWRFSENWEANKLIAKLLAEMQNHSGIDFTIGTTRTWSNAGGGDDSAGDPFPDADSDKIDGIYEWQIGATTILDEVLKLADGNGYQIDFRPGLIWDMYRTIGRDLRGAFDTDTVRFEKGVNIAAHTGEGLTRQMPGKVWGTDALIKTKTGYTRAHIARDPYPYGIFLDMSNLSGSNTRDRRLAGRFLRGAEVLDTMQVEVTPYGKGGRLAEANHPELGYYYPGPRWSENGKYWVGDIITLHTGTEDFDYNGVGQRIYGIRIAEDEETGELAVPIVELNAPTFKPDGSNVGTSVSAYSGTTAAGSSSPSGSGSGGTAGGGTSTPAIHSHSAAATSYDNGGSGLTADDVQEAIDELASGSGSAAPNDANYLVGTANPDLTSEIVVGTSPGGELGGTWGSPTVDTTHSGSAHADFIAKALVDAKGDLIAATAADTVARFPVGTDGQALLADSTQTAGLRWGDVAVTAASIAALGFVGPILMVDGITSPPEPMQTEDGTDWLYADLG